MPFQIAVLAAFVTSVVAIAGETPPRPEPRVLLPTADQHAVTWRHTFAEPAADWFKADFNDSAWKEGAAGFGTRGTPNAVLGTVWNTPDVWLRTAFDYDGADLKTAAVRIHHDEDARDSDDPHGVLLKPIPEKLVVLTFDDGCASGATVVAPILKSLGFGATFYVCDFDSFHTRKDWYLTWRQMRALADAGLEIGNHTRGHGGGLGNYLDMEDELLANGVPKPTTLAWPVYQVVWNACPDLAANGYTFGRGGHSRVYRPTVDHPFDVPSFSVQDGVSVETFSSYVRKATQGKTVVITFHGVPDGEHPGVSLDPATFEVMMHYLKDNHYQGIAMRDLARFIDPAKAAKLPPTADNVKEAGAAPSVKDDVPPRAVVAKNIETFAFPGLPPVRPFVTRIDVTVPYATDITALAPVCTVSAGATIAPASGALRDFSRPQVYTVTGQDGSTKAYTATVRKAAASVAKDMLTFVLPGATSAVISGAHVGAYVPPATDVTALAPTFTLPPFAKAVPASGTPRDFTRPQTYTTTAQDGSTQVCTVTVVKSDQPNTFTWKKAEAGNWSDALKWTNPLRMEAAPIAAGQADYVLDFGKPGIGAVTNDLNEGFLLNQLNCGSNAPVKIEGKGGLAFAANKAIAARPRINKGPGGGVTVATPVQFASDVTVDVGEHGEVDFGGLLSGPGSLTKNGEGRLRITHAANTYSGGTVINGGSLLVIAANQGLGAGPVTLDGDGALDLEHVEGANPLILNGGTVNAGNGFGDTWNSPITLNGDTKISSYADFQLNNKSGGMSGPGGFTHIGSVGAFGMVNSGTVTLCGANTYTGATTVRRGTLRVLKAASLYNADPTQWTPARISVATAATLRMNVGGPGEFTSEHVAALLRNLTTSVDNNGLMAGAVLCLDTANATAPVVVPPGITDSKGPGGGAFVLKKCGAGVLQFSGNNTYTGQTILEGGTLSVASLNSVAGGKAGSSLGAPTNVEAGEIVMGSGDGEVALIYTGAGETSDRVVNLAGKKSTVTFDQSGAGLLKLTSPFVISGYGASKTLVLKGDTAGTGEIAGGVANPYDRAGKATTAVTKSGTGTWTLSGTNSYTGPTKITGGVLACASAASLGSGSLDIRAGAKLQLNYGGTRQVSALAFGAAAQADGTYGSTASPATNKNDTYFAGTGTVTVVTPKADNNGRGVTVPTK